jgi:agmatinase
VSEESPATPIGPVDASVVPRFVGLRTFARLPGPELVDRAAIAILGAPFDGGASFRPGARFGPSAIREASLLIRGYNEALDVGPFGEVQVVDAGDAVANPIVLADAHAAIESAAAALHAGGARVLGLGGDHSVSLPLLRAAAAHHGPLALIQFDAHTDTTDEFFGTRVNHGTMFRRAVEEGTVDGARSVQIGLRGSVYGPEHHVGNRELGFRTLLAREVEEVGIGAGIELVREAVRGPVYVTVDIDCLDPAFAPGTGTPEPGGLTSRELYALLRGLAPLDLDIVGCDVVEVAPAYDPTGATAVAASNAAFELLSLLALRARR